MVVQNVGVPWNNAHIAIYNAPACTAQLSNAECNEIAAPRIVFSMQCHGASVVCTGDSQHCSFLSRAN